MITRVDHVVVAVRDLDRAIAGYRDVLGLDARPGGRHTNWGTYNGIVRFGLDYLELLAVYDPDFAAGTGPNGEALLEFLGRREGGLVGYCLAADPLEPMAEQLRRNGLDVDGPFAMERLRPDGRLLKWRLLIPGAVAWRRSWPFLIEWGIPDQERLGWEPPGRHPLGVTGLAGIAVAVDDLESAKRLYAQDLGLTPAGEGAVPALAANRVRFAVGSFSIDLLAPSGPGPVRQELEATGAGPYQVMLRVRDIAQARSWLAQKNVAVEPALGVPEGLLIDPAQALGARFVLVPALW